VSDDPDHDATPRLTRRSPPRRASYPLGVPVPAPPPPGDELTNPFDLLEREPDHEVQAVVQRSRRDSADPATFGDVVKLAVALTREKSGNRQRERDTEEVLRGPRAALRSSRRHLIAAVLAAAASIAGAVTKWGSHPAPASDTGDAVRVQQQLQHEIDRLDSELREIRLELGRRSELTHHQVPAGALPASIVTGKGTIQ